MTCTKVAAIHLGERWTSTRTHTCSTRTELGVRDYVDDESRLLLDLTESIIAPAAPTLIRIDASCFLVIGHSNSSLSIVRIIKEEDRSLVHHTTPIHTPHVISQLRTIHPSVFLLIHTSSTVKDIASGIHTGIPTPRIPEYRTGQLTSRPAGQRRRRPRSREGDLCSG
jgi:hypothetical protein